MQESSVRAWISDRGCSWRLDADPRSSCCIACPDSGTKAESFTEISRPSPTIFHWLPACPLAASCRHQDGA